MTRALLLALCACNDVYGLAPTQLLDGRPIDAPARCTGELVFPPQLHQVVFRECVDYTFANDRAVAACPRSGPFDVQFAEGTIDGPLVDIAIAPTLPMSQLVKPRVSPEGELFVLQRLEHDGNSQASVYQRSDAGWTWNRDLPFALAPVQNLGVPSRGPQRHLMITRGSVFEEAIDDGNNVWSTKTYPVTDLGVGPFNGPINLSSDGLRAVFVSDTGVRYAVRPTIGEAFNGSVPVDAPLVTDAFLTEDCSRLYFAGLNSVFYLQR